MTLNDLVKQYKEEPSPELLDQITIASQSMIRRYARSFGRTLQHSDREDLEGELWLEFVRIVRHRLSGLKGDFKKFLSTRLYYASLKFYKRLRGEVPIDYDITACEDHFELEYLEVLSKCVRTVPEKTVLNDLLDLVRPEETADKLGLSTRRVYQIRDELHDRMKGALNA